MLYFNLKLDFTAEQLRKTLTFSYPLIIILNWAGTQSQSQHTEREEAIYMIAFFVTNIKPYAKCLLVDKQSDVMAAKCLR